MTSIPLRVGGRLIADTADLVRRFAGLPWSGGPPETWAWDYYDAVPSDQGDDTVSPVDVLAAGVLHPGLSRSDLAFFRDRSPDLRSWLSQIPLDDDLQSTTGWLTDNVQLEHLDELAHLADGIQLTLLTKVLHRKRPAFVPLLDRHLIDRYRPLTGERRAVEAWPKVLRCLRDDLAAPEDRVALATAAGEISEAASRGGCVATISVLRYVDIAVWMSAR